MGHGIDDTVELGGLLPGAVEYEVVLDDLRKRREDPALLPHRTRTWRRDAATNGLLRALCYRCSGLHPNGLKGASLLEGGSESKELTDQDQRKESLMLFLLGSLVLRFALNGVISKVCGTRPVLTGWQFVGTYGLLVLGRAILGGGFV